MGICDGDCYTGCPCGDVPEPDADGCLECGCPYGCVCADIHEMKVERRRRRRACYRETGHAYATENNGPRCLCGETRLPGPMIGCRDCLLSSEDCTCIPF